MRMSGHRDSRQPYAGLSPSHGTAHISECVTGTIVAAAAGSGPATRPQIAVANGSATGRVQIAHAPVKCLLSRQPQSWQWHEP